MLVNGFYLKGFCIALQGQVSGFQAGEQRVSSTSADTGDLRVPGDEGGVVDATGVYGHVSVYS